MQSFPQSLAPTFARSVCRKSVRSSSVEQERLLRRLFGDKPASAMAQIALRKTAEENKDGFLEAAETITKNSYMDDICDSVDDVESAKKLTGNIDTIFSKGGFSVKEWTSNEDLTKGLNRDDSDETVLQVDGDEDEGKVLGVAWKHKTDELRFKVREDMLVPVESSSCDQNTLTKRKIMSKVARIYDPIGLASALIIRAKIGLQNLWQTGADWDDKLPNEAQEHWKALFQEITKLNQVSFQRSLLAIAAGASEEPMLCVFSDASEEAFGACAYIRQRGEDKYMVNLIAAKSRVAPLKRVPIPHLELQAGVLASRLARTIQEEARIKFGDVVFFTDSMIVLAWIHRQSRSFKPFVSARVGEIQNNSDPKRWRHIPECSRRRVPWHTSGRVKSEMAQWTRVPSTTRIRVAPRSIPGAPQERGHRVSPGEGCRCSESYKSRRSYRRATVFKLEEANQSNCIYQKTRSKS